MQLRKQLTDYWEERAETVLSNFNHKYPDEIDITNICWMYGIRILPLDTSFLEYCGVKIESIDGLKAYSVPKNKDRQGTIFLKEHLPHVERKLLVAEEFCHLYAHHTSQLNIDKYAVAKMEEQAKRMSAYLLMPSRFLGQVYEIAMDEAVLISDIADYFFVTEEFAQYRLELIFKHKVDGFTTLRGKLGTLEWMDW
ncbi:ImmA/IrrE family metallo-endopeptidase [Sporosarcina saromensis]|uniref:ImmA/IrrE family metallo-endopeptidase n=1 Tax=Sporosarcina saromensis TaxID=359365 RepID=A0ABU4G5K3_9BACL|nr:ImmA/IrrE family metallo-endopeptidase [Sporosarcina saromensis]MDW0112245.1 ImmA/IrrE family metallo-endopeptidase [Sporosarcina saromensis]